MVIPSRRSPFFSHPLFCFSSPPVPAPSFLLPNHTPGAGGDAPHFAVGVIQPLVHVEETTLHIVNQEPILLLNALQDCRKLLLFSMVTVVAMMATMVLVGAVSRSVAVTCSAQTFCLFNYTASRVTALHTDRQSVSRMLHHPTHPWPAHQSRLRRAPRRRLRRYTCRRRVAVLVGMEGQEGEAAVGGSTCVSCH